MASSSNFTVVQELGEYVIPVSTDTAWSAFYYLYENPVTLEREVKDEEGNVILDENDEPVTEYVPSKLAMRIEPISYLMSGGSRYTSNNQWFVLMPNDFIIQEAYQPGNNNPKAEEWNIGSSDGDTDLYPFIPQRVPNKFIVSELNIKSKVVELLYIKY